MFRTVYDDDADKAAADAAKAADDKTIHLTQEELNTMMSENRKKLTKQNSDAIAELTKLKDSVKITGDEKVQLELKISELEEQFLSKEEIATKAIATATKKHQQLVDGLTTERDDWKKRYSTSTIERSLQDAAIAEEAISPSQIVAMLGQNTHLIEAIDEAGNPNGVYIPTVKFNDVDEDGKAIVNDLEPLVAIKRMKELTNLYGNLFKGTAKGGVGEDTVEGGDNNQPKLEDITSDSAKYAAWRKKNPGVDPTTLRR